MKLSLFLIDRYNEHFVSCVDSRIENHPIHKIKLYEKINSDGDFVYLLIPGFFQNPLIFDLYPEKKVSFAKYLEKKAKGKIFLFCPRGIQGSDYPAKSNMDDYAIDDYSGVVDYLCDKYPKKKIVLIGHSQGAITLQAYLAGITRENGAVCFREDIAKERADKVFGTLLLAGSVSMKSDEGANSLLDLAKYEPYMRWLLNIKDRIPAFYLTKIISPATSYWWHPFSGRASLAYSVKQWAFLMESHKVEDDILARHYDWTLEHSPSEVIKQFAEGVRTHSIKTRNGLAYADYLKNIKTKVAQIAFEKDGMAYPHYTLDSSFRFIGSKDKKFFDVKNQKHADIFMSEENHTVASDALNWLLGL